jgi:hypothetical protein
VRVQVQELGLVRLRRVLVPVRRRQAQASQSGRARQVQALEPRVAQRRVPVRQPLRPVLPAQVTLPGPRAAR